MEASMPSKASYKKRGGQKVSADKNTFNPPGRRGSQAGTQTHQPEEQLANKRTGQFGESGNPPLMKK
jgi:hypothetical protein